MNSAPICSFMGAPPIAMKSNLCRTGSAFNSFMTNISPKIEGTDIMKRALVEVSAERVECAVGIIDAGGNTQGMPINSAKHGARIPNP